MHRMSGPKNLGHAMKRGLGLLLALLLAGCAATPTAPVTQHDAGLLADHLFAPPSEPANVADVFAVSDEMRRYLESEIAAVARVKGRQRALYDALYSKGQLKLEYDTERTRNAARPLPRGQATACRWSS